MQCIQCTQKLLKKLPVQPEECLSDPGLLGDWHANLICIERHNCVLFVNDRTLYSVYVAGLLKPDFAFLIDIFQQNLFKRLVSDGFSQQQIENVLDEYSDVCITKTRNRAILGSMNAIVQIVKHVVWRNGFEHFDPGRLNEIPMGALRYTFPIDNMRKLLS